jgi:hypothetical protein
MKWWFGGRSCCLPASAAPLHGAICRLCSAASFADWAWRRRRCCCCARWVSCRAMANRSCAAHTARRPPPTCCKGSAQKSSDWVLLPLPGLPLCTLLPHQCSICVWLMFNKWRHTPSYPHLAHPLARNGGIYGDLLSCYVGCFC